MNTSSSAQRPQQALAFPADENSIESSTTILSQPVVFSSVLFPRLAVVDPRVKSRPGVVDIDTSKLSTTTIKRSQAISNIQDLDEDSPWALENDPIESFHSRKAVQTTNELSNFNKRIPRKRATGGDESDTRSESSEKNPEYIEEDKIVLSGIHVKGATLNRLIRILIDSFRE